MTANDNLQIFVVKRILVCRWILIGGYEALTYARLLDKDCCLIIQLPPKEKDVHIFVDQETGNVTASPKFEDGDSNAVYATFHLNEVRWNNLKQWSLGRLDLSSVYMTDFYEPDDKMSTPRPLGSDADEAHM